MQARHELFVASSSLQFQWDSLLKVRNCRVDISRNEESQQVLGEVNLRHMSSCQFSFSVLYRQFLGSSNLLDALSEILESFVDGLDQGLAKLVCRVL